jgi:hypothetical protein
VSLETETVEPADMTLLEFETALTNDVAIFFAKWRLNHIDEPANWPMQMGHADWMEQFLCDISNG